VINIPSAPIESTPSPASVRQLRLVRQEFSRAKAYAAEYRGTTPIAHFFNTRLKKVGAFVGDLTTGRVLDVGCGPALVGEVFQGRPIDYYGVDVSEEMLHECEATFGALPRFHFSLGRIEELPFPDHSFDVVLCLGALEYLPDAHRAMTEMARVVKRNGVVIVTMLNTSSPYRLWARYGYGKLRNGANRLRRFVRRNDRAGGASTPGRPFSHEYTETALRDLLTRADLHVHDVVYYDFNVFLEPLDKLFPTASVHVSRRLECLGRSRLKGLGTGFIVAARAC
jgi:ubiquinone/menaquinone biosynthesis C-methylase UbiE